MSILALASLVTLGAGPYAFSEEFFYSNEDGADIFVDDCNAANFSVTIDGTEYGPGDVASGFSLESDFSVSAGEGVTVGWVTNSIVQGSYGHGGARTPLDAPGELNMNDAVSNWRELNNIVFYESLIFFPSIFYAECPGNVGRYAYIQTFPGLTLAQAGYAANLEQGVYVSDQALLDSLGLVDSDTKSLAFAPRADFKNAAYSFWANYLESTFLANESAFSYFSDDPEFTLEDLDQGVWGVWAWVGFGEYGEIYTPEEFASSFYSYSNESDELTEIGIDDVFEEEAAPTTTPATTTPATTAPATTAPASTTPVAALATTGANVEWLLVAGLLAVIAGSGLLAFGRRKRIW
jgi:LPXTG-motif cell wall-anchored protein